MPSSSLSPKIPVVVCEFHQEVLQYIHRFIARKKLPFNDMTMVHFDSHPDLAFPQRLTADDVYCKEKMYNDLDIADWIFPLMYAGHLHHLYWVKPPWANQIAEKTLQFAIGKEVDTGLLKVTSTEDYFLEDCMFALREKLTNARDVVVESVELNTLLNQVCDESAGRGGALEKQPATNNLNGSGDERKANVDNEFAPELTCDVADDDDEGVCSSTKKMKTNPGDIERGSISPKSLKDVDAVKPSNGVNEKTTVFLSKQKYVLDIDLDFFSVTNPFMGDYTPAQFKVLKETYAINPPKCKDDESLVQDWVDSTTQKLNNLKRIIDLVASGCPTDDIETDTNSEFIALLQSLRENGEDMDWELVHNAGCSMGVPHHVSTEAEVDVLVEQMVRLLRQLPTPSVITIARSTVDEYCPPHQIEMIQEKVVKALQGVYVDLGLDINYDYKDESRIIA